MLRRDNRTPVGRLIEEAREALNLTQAEAARRAGFSSARWRVLVTGSGGNPKAETLARMAEAVHLPPRDLASVRPDVAVTLLRRMAIGTGAVIVSPEDCTESLRAIDSFRSESLRTLDLLRTGSLDPLVTTLVRVLGMAAVRERIPAR